ncbi:aspartate aminotransferase family protein [Pyruvatibacter sp.]|uniref:aspartate aminotransferase family protein n=1 Tax=Pyruvatibacter sp. TaxID=1981328 RepID=UPI0032EACA29
MATPVASSPSASSSPITPVLPTYARADISFERGEGAWLITPTGERYLDFGAGVAVNALGHAHPKLIAALTEQAHKVWHVSNLYEVEGQKALAQKLIDLTFADTVFFANSGAEALEASIKMARKYHAASGHPERFELITFEGAFHGRTLATIAAGGQQKYLDGFGPATPGFVQVALNDIAAVKAALTDATAGFLIEPVQGEGGIREASKEFIRQLRALADEHGLLLIFDEVQSGVGRTGHLYAYQDLGIEPDILATAKGLGGGFPVGACLATAEAAKGMTPGTHGSTFGGNPLAMAVGKAVLDEVSQPSFLENVRRVSGRLSQGLTMIADEYPGVIESVRGRGLMLGLKCIVPNTDIQKALMGKGLLTVAAGDNVVRLLPPLIITEDEAADAVSRIEAVCADIAAQLADKKEA